MKKYAFLLFFTLLWATVSPFVAFRFICGKFVPEKENASEAYSEDSSKDSSKDEYINLETDKSKEEFSKEETSSLSDEVSYSRIELLTAEKLSEIDYQSYSLECQKAIATAIRTQIVFENNFNLLTVSSEPISPIPRCVLETEGLIITYNKNPINAEIHKSSYKTTISSLGGEKYLLSVETTENEEENKTVLTFSKEEFKNIIKELCPNVIFESEEKLIKKLVFNEENRCFSINAGNSAFSAEALAKKLSFPSTAFTIDEDNKLLTITIYGEGSGIGLSIEGAEALSNEGKTFSEILKHYYTGVELEIADGVF